LSKEGSGSGGGALKRGGPRGKKRGSWCAKEAKKLGKKATGAPHNKGRENRKLRGGGKTWTGISNRSGVGSGGRDAV